VARHPLQHFIRRLCRKRSAAEEHHLTDARLLERFARDRDEAAFEVLVWRHAALVLHVAQRVVRQPSDAEDVFQATFLTLARKAGSIRKGTALASWLYKVAYRIGVRLRRSTVRREQYERSTVEKVSEPASTECEDAELRAALADEVQRLPERYRAAVVLCYLQGLTTTEAGRVLGCPQGTVLSRLAWARQRLRARLIRRGLAPATALTALSFLDTARALPPQTLILAVVRAALPFAAGRTALVTAVSPQVAALAQGALRAMMWTKIKIAVLMLVMVGLAGTGAGWLTRGRVVVEVIPAVAAEAAREPAESDRAKKERAIRMEELRKELAMVDDELQLHEDRLSRQVIQMRLQMLQAEERVRAAERERDFERRGGEQRLLPFQSSIFEEEKTLDKISALKGDNHPELARSRKHLEELRRKIEAISQEIKASEERHTARVLAARKEIMELEEDLRRIQQRQRRQQEYLLTLRQLLIERLHEFQVGVDRPEPPDRIRALERKLDRLHREVIELRRALEKQPGRQDDKR
jgi:RNA polymerase sigma factor (sigma-70 family)